MKVYEITSPGHHDSCIELSAEDCLTWLEEIDVGDKIMIQAIDMDEDKIKVLPDFEGF